MRNTSYRAPEPDELRRGDIAHLASPPVRCTVASVEPGEVGASIVIKPTHDREWTRFVSYEHLRAPTPEDRVRPGTLKQGDAVWLLLPPQPVVVETVYGQPGEHGVQVLEFSPSKGPIRAIRVQDENLRLPVERELAAVGRPDIWLQTVEEGIGLLGWSGGAKPRETEEHYKMRATGALRSLEQYLKAVDEANEDLRDMTTAFRQESLYGAVQGRIDTVRGALGRLTKGDEGAEVALNALQWMEDHFRHWDAPRLAKRVTELEDRCADLAQELVSSELADMRRESDDWERAGPPIDHDIPGVVETVRNGLQVLYDNNAPQTALEPLERLQAYISTLERELVRLDVQARNGAEIDPAIVVRDLLGMITNLLHMGHDKEAQRRQHQSVREMAFKLYRVSHAAGVAVGRSMQRAGELPSEWPGPAPQELSAEEITSRAEAIVKAAWEREEAPAEEGDPSVVVIPEAPRPPPGWIELVDKRLAALEGKMGEVYHPRLAR